MSLLNIVVPFDDPEPDGTPFNKPEYKTAYIELSNVAQSKGAQIYFARGYDAYLSEGKFQNCYFYDEADLLIGPVSVLADVIYDKSTYYDAKDFYRIINEPALKKFCNDKYQTYLKFRDYSPQTLHADNPVQVKNMIKQIHTDTVVVKSTIGAGGAQVAIGKKDEISYGTLPYPVIIQEFIDTSEGIPGLCAGHHDLRITVANGNLIMALIRTPAEGSLKANVNSGGSLFFVKLDEVPDDAIALAKEIDKNLPQHTTNRFYTIDMVFGNGRYYLIELNSQPGVWMQSRGEESIAYQEKLIDFLIATSTEN